jgi:hypothetical protein
MGGAMTNRYNFWHEVADRGVCGLLPSLGVRLLPVAQTMIYLNRDDLPSDQCRCVNHSSLVVSTATACRVSGERADQQVLIGILPR